MFRPMSSTTAQLFSPYRHQIHSSREVQKLLIWCTGRSSPEKQESCLLLPPSGGELLQNRQKPALPALRWSLLSGWEMPPLLRIQGPEPWSLLAEAKVTATPWGAASLCLQQLRIQRCPTTTAPNNLRWDLLGLSTIKSPGICGFPKT